MRLPPEVSSAPRGRDRLAGIPLFLPVPLVLWLRGSTGASGGLPFPVHIQALLGTAWVVWLFRVVGLWWLGAALLYLSGNHGLRP